MRILVLRLQEERVFKETGQDAGLEVCQTDPWAAYLNSIQRQGQQNMVGQQSSVPSSSSGGCVHHAPGGCLRHGGCLPQGQGGCLSQDPGGYWSRGFVTQPGVSLSGQGQGLARTAYDLSHGVQERSQGVPV